MDSQSKTIKAVMRATLQARKVPSLVGEPGTGKTETVRAIARELGYELITLLGSTMEPTDVAGFPKSEVVYTETNSVTGEEVPVHGTVFLPPAWQVQVMKKKKVIIFMDEYSNAPASVRAGFLTIIQNREFPSGVKMPEETLMVVAMNPPEQAADGYEMDLPTSNRLVWLTWDPTVEEWIEGMRTAWGRKVSEEELRWKNLIASFIEDEGRTYLHNMPGTVSGREGNKTNSPQAFGIPNNPSAHMVYRSAWPSRRSWDNLSQALVYASKDHTIQDTLAEATVGAAAAASFRDWLKKNENNLQPEKVIAAPEKVQWDSIAPDSAHSVLRELVRRVNEKNGLAIINVFRVIAEAKRADLGAPFMTDLVKAVTAGNLPKEAKDANKKAMHELFPLYKEIGKHHATA